MKASLVPLLHLLLKVARVVAQIIETEKLMDAGEARLMVKQLDKSNATLSKARKARSAAMAAYRKRGRVHDDNDPNLRD